MRATMSIHSTCRSCIATISPACSGGAFRRSAGTTSGWRVGRASGRSRYRRRATNRRRSCQASRPGSATRRISCPIRDRRRCTSWSSPRATRGRYRSSPTNVSLFTDVDDSELKRADANAREVLRLDALLRESDAAVARHTHHIHHLEQIVAERERLIVERDAALARDAAQLRALEAQVGERDATLGERDRQLAAANAAQEERDAELAHRAETIAGLGKRSAALEAEKERLQVELAAEQPRIAYLDSFRGWIAWPWRHLRQWLGG